MLITMKLLNTKTLGRAFSSSPLYFKIMKYEPNEKPIPLRSKRLPAEQKPFSGPDTVRILMTKFDFRLSVIQRYLEDAQLSGEIILQDRDQKLLKSVRDDLCAAHFVVDRGGSVKFVGEQRWNVKNRPEGEEMEDEIKNYVLPFSYVPGLYVEAINAKGMSLHYEGLEHFENLKYMKWLSLEGCPYIDDWCLDRISALLGDTLEYLDLTDCKQVSSRGLYCFYRFTKLKTLKVNGIADTPDFKLACCMLEEINPALTVEGVEYIIPEETSPAGDTTTSV